jgi:pilus assembly protein CpaC
MSKSGETDLRLIERQAKMMSGLADRKRRVRDQGGISAGRSHPAIRAFIAFAAVLGLGVFLSWQGRALSAGIVEDETGSARHIVVTVFKSRTLRINEPFSSAVVAQPEIADVLPMTDTSIYIQGKKVGTTNISVFDPKHHIIAVLDLEVVPDTGNLRSKIQASTGGGGIHVTSANGQVVLSGEARDAVSAERAVQVAKGLSPESPVVNAMKVAPSQQVMLKVRILEASRDAGRDLGINWFIANNKGTRGFTTGTGVPISTGRPAIGGVNAQGLANAASPGIPLFSAIAPFAGNTSAPFGTLLAGFVNNGMSIDALVSALESKGLVRALAEPDLIALSGDTASFLAGGEIPIPVVQSSSGTVPTITVDYKPFGVQLTFMPTVLANGVINLRLAPSVSEIDNANSVQISGFTIPALTKREARTTVELRDGQSFAIAGLLQSINVEDLNQLPWIGSVPVLGTLFRSTSFQKHETDLVIIVTPHLVRPAVPGEHLASPFDQKLQGNDVDVFAMGQFERKKKFNEWVTSGGEVAGPYGHMLPTDQGADDYVTKK